MFMLLPVLGSAAVGGLIGYSTNWLAIRMLFRPLEEKRIWGVRVPFTPGLIPKKRAKLAESLGETVGKYLVTPETLSASLQDEAFGESIQQAVTRIIDKLSEDKTVYQLLEERNLLESVQRASALVAPWVVGRLQKSEVQEHLYALLRSLLNQIGQAGISQALSVNREDQASSLLLREAIIELVEGEPLRGWLSGLITQQVNKTLVREESIAELLGDDAVMELRRFLLERMPDWLDYLQAKLQQEESRVLIKGLINEFLANNTMLKILSAFADIDKITDSLTGLLAKDETRTRVAYYAMQLVEKTLHTPLRQLSLGLDLETGEQLVHDLVARLCTTGNLERIFREFAGMVEAEGNQVPEELSEQLHRVGQLALAQTVNSPGFGQLLGEAVNSLLIRLLESKPQDLLPLPSEDTVARWVTSLHDWLRQLVAKYGPGLLLALRLPQVVEQQINGLDIIDVEEILLRVMREQLRAITNLGFLLGALLGMIMPFLNLWLMNV